MKKLILVLFAIAMPTSGFTDTSKAKVTVQPTPKETIQPAGGVRLVLPGELSKHSMSEGTKTTTAPK
jgi:hypothetical protein